MKNFIVDLLYKSLKKEISKQEIEKLIEIPPSSEMGDYAFPCFILSKKLKQNPNKISEELANKIKLPKELEKIESKGPYLNFFLNKINFSEETIQKVLEEKNNYGRSDKKSKKLVIEFSQPNTHKAFHVGHIRGTSIGESISRISEFLGDKVIRANYSGDTGMHIAKWIWCYKNFHSKERLRKDESWIASIYVDAVKRLKQNESFQEEVNKINKLIENKGDKKINELWKKTRQLSIDSWKKIYQELNTKFDVHYFESQVEKEGKKISQELVKKGIAKISEGATIADLKEYDLGVWVLLRSDGTVLYSAKDIALAYKKSKEYDADKYIVVVGNEQDFHFKQLEKILELMKFKNAGEYTHLPFGMVRLPHGKMSSRTGDNILYSDFIKELGDYAKKQLKEKTPNISKKEIDERALKISIASIKYSMLKQSPNKNIIFDKKEALNFEGDTGPYILYSYARANSILKKVKSKNSGKINELASQEFELAKKINQFPEVVEESYRSLNPAVIANYSYQLAQTFNEFYHACPVMGSGKESFRLKLIKAFSQTLKNSLFLLGIDVLGKM